MSKSLHVLVKPASSLCNLACTYCFYLDVAEQQGRHHRHFMTEEIMSRLINEVLLLSDGGQITFGFQGGEPLLVPLDFYRHFIDEVSRLNHKNSKIEYTLQTNGLFITEEHASFFKEHHFLIGLSLDGGEKIHNLFRLSQNGQPTYDRVIQVLDLLKKHDVFFNVLVVVTHQSAPHIKVIYEELKHLGVFYMQFIPVLEPLNTEPFSMSYALTQEDYAFFHSVLWDLYTEDRQKGTFIFIRYFDNLKHMMNKNRVEQCGVSGMCHAQIIVESNGTVYPCDFYSDKNHELGNIMDKTLRDLVKHPIMKSFIIDSLQIHENCQKCDVYHLCRGGCRRYHANTNDSGGKHRYCEGIKQFINLVQKTF